MRNVEIIDYDFTRHGMNQYNKCWAPNSEYEFNYQEYKHLERDVKQINQGIIDSDIMISYKLLNQMFKEITEIFNGCRVT